MGPTPLTMVPMFAVWTRQARQVVVEIHRTNQAGLGLANLPYQVGAGTAAVAVSCKALSFCCAPTVFLSKTVPFLAVHLQRWQGFISIPMVFDLPTALWFNRW
eukprot:SAG22_NODE_7561_length_728_cov_1.941176_1_plen_102_part_10